MRFYPDIICTATIAKEFTFDAAHYLPTVPEGHKCRRMHGHTYRVELMLVGAIGKTGFVEDIDYDDIAKAWSKVHEQIDHQVLNNILAVPSTENLTLWILRQLYDDRIIGGHLESVRVSESSTTWCEIHRHQLESVMNQESTLAAQRAREEKAKQ